MDEPIKILCVDDESNVLRSLKRLFHRFEYQIYFAESGEEGLQIMSSEPGIQLIISDYRMPGMTGVQFLCKVYEKWPETIRLVLSGYADIPAIVSAINEGHIYKFMAKPWNDDELKIAVSNALDKYFMQKKNILLTKELAIKNMELKGIVDRKSADLIMSSKILTFSQQILEDLPVSVIGLDPNGVIFLCNGKSFSIFNPKDGIIIGEQRTSFFSKEINNFIDTIIAKGANALLLMQNCTKIKANGIHIKSVDGLSGIILTFDEIAADENI